MAELIGLGLAVPGVLATLYTFGMGILQRLEDIKRYDDNMNRYRQIGVNMSTGLIRTQVKLVVAALHDDLLPADVKHGLDESFRYLIQAIIDADDEFKKSRRLRLSGKLQILGLGENINLRNQLNVLEQHQLIFERYSNYVNLYRAMPVPYKLDFRKFRVRGEHGTSLPGRKLPTSDVFTCSGELSKNEHPELVEVILEERFYNTRIQQQAEEDLRILIGKLTLAQQLSGVPECLGYRQGLSDDKFELIFRLPNDCAVRSLADMLVVNNTPPLEERLTICQMLASSVSDIHGLNLVHKNIRPRSILLVRPNADSRTKGILLTDWTLVREVSDASTWRGEERWDRAVYQHPTRQGPRAEKHYTFTHDIYSLGVCMLEILLWKSLVVTTEGPDLNEQNSFSEIFQTRAAKLAPNSSIPTRHLHAPERLIRYPKLISAVIADLASTDLPSITGSKISSVVIQALGNAHEGSEEQGVVSGNDPIESGVEYLRDILLVLNSVSI